MTDTHEPGTTVCRFILEPLKRGAEMISATELPRSIPVSGANQQDTEMVARQFRLLTDLYASGCKVMLDKLAENIPLDHRAMRFQRAMRSFSAGLDEIADDMQGAIENAVE
jgi:hypothetical protein